jgi:endonuclease-3
VTYQKLTPKQKAEVVSTMLKLDYPSVSTPLHHKNAYELLVAVMLSAQTLDKYVNKVTPSLFKKYPTVQDLAEADSIDVEKFVKGVNYYRTKARHLVEMAKKIVNEYNGEIPGKMEELIKLPGVGRKTANVVINEWFVNPSPALPLSGEGERTPSSLRYTLSLKKGEMAKPEGIIPEGFVVDTHVKRVAKRLGLTKHDDPKKVEQDLMKLFPREEWPSTSLRMIFHGRYRCTAKNPKCKDDPVWRKVCSCVNESRD